MLQMQYLRHTVKYILRLLLAIIVAMVCIGIATYNFDVKWYVEYLNTRNIGDVSITNPITILQLFVPSEPTEAITLEDLLEEESDTTSWSLEVDIDFESFFGDFSQQDRSASVMTWEDFGFVTDPVDITWSQETSLPQLTEEEQKQLLIEQLRLRELRLQQEAEMQAQ